MCVVSYSQGTAGRTNEQCSVAVQPAVVILSEWNRILEKLIPGQVVKKFSTFCGSYGIFTVSTPAAEFYPQPSESSPHTNTLYSYFKSVFIVLRLEMGMNFLSVLSVPHAAHIFWVLICWPLQYLRTQILRS